VTQTENLAYEAIDREFAAESANTRRKFVGGAAAALGGMGLLGATGAGTAIAKSAGKANPQNILNIAATAEVLATIVNTVGAERVALDSVTKANVEAAAFQELDHYKVLRSIGGRPATKKIWVPDAVFSSSTGLLSTLVIGDQVFVNAYLIATTSFANKGDAISARYAAEIMGVESVHRALALQSLGQLGNDRAFAKYKFTNINHAPVFLQKKGFGFGKEGAKPGAFYDFDEVKRRTPSPSGVNSLKPR
jgi:hypothetical protein